MNRLAYKIVQQSIGEAVTATKVPDARRSPGGKARAEKLTADQRSKIAKKAANQRWKKKSAS